MVAQDVRKEVGPSHKRSVEEVRFEKVRPPYLELAHSDVAVEPGFESFPEVMATPDQTRYALVIQKFSDQEENFVR